MATSTAFPQQTLIGAIWPAGSLSQPVRLAILALAGTALLALSEMPPSREALPGCA